MSDFRTKFLGLAAIATAFAGMSYGQVSCAGGTQTTNVSPLLARAEGAAELVSDVILTCPASSAVSNGQLTVFTSLAVTSKAVPAVAPLTGNTEAILAVTNVTASTTAFYSGTVAPGASVITFTGITFPANFIAQISNVRVNASSSGAGATPVPITESVFAGTNGSATLVNNNIIVGYALKSLATPSLVVSPITGFPQITNYTVCAGNAVSGLVASAPLGVGAALGPAFQINLAETFGGAFKVQTDATHNVANQEQGSLLSGAIGSAATGTQIAFTFANVPASATLYLPLSVTNGPLTITLAGSPTIATTPAGLTIAGGGPSIFTGAGDGPVAFTPTNGSVTATYTVISSSAATIESAVVPVFVTFAANSAAAQTAITVLEAYAPTATLTGPATSIPIFAPTSNTPLNGSTITICQTTLLFPFVTNAAGFETGMAIANTTTDNLTSTGKSSATPTNGTCSVNFYVPGTQGAAFVTPTIGVAAPVYANTFSAMSGATNTSGYAIAQCNFLDAHGYAFVESGLGTTSGVAEGYLATVIPNTRLAADGGNGN
jgi:hypothetical protein